MVLWVLAVQWVCAALLWTTLAAAADFEPYPLDPPDTGSPRETMRSFITHMNAAYHAYTSGGDFEDVARPFRKAIRTLDLSATPPTLRNDVGGYSVLLLKEILDRVALPDLAEIPDRDDIERTGSSAWTVPRTEITLERVPTGARAGEFLFSLETVAHLDEFFHAVRHLPYKPGAAQGIFDLYIDNPGGLVPFHWAERMPGWVFARVFERPIWKWIALAAYVVAAVALVSLAYRLGRGWDRRIRDRGGHLSVNPIVMAATLALLAWGLDVYVDDIVALRGPPEAAIKRGSLVFLFTAAVVGLFALFELIAQVIIASNRVRQHSVDAHFIKVVIRIVAIGIGIYIVVEASGYLGWAVAPLVAGLGVGGLAVALAARPTVENVIGGLILFADRPVRVGDFCRYGDSIGTVEEVGLRSTRIRSLDRTLVSVPNAEFSQMKIENFDKRDRMLFRTIVKLRYETTADQLRYVIAKLREMLLGHPKVTNDPARARFWDYGVSSLDIEVFAYVRSCNWNEYLAIREDLNFRIMEIVKTAGASFAFPSQTMYVARDSGPDGERRACAEARIEELRSKGQLPFPEFDAELRRQIADVLDYPPEGSPDHAPHPEPPMSGRGETASNEPNEPSADDRRAAAIGRRTGGGQTP